jgi:hypothetical protein
MNDERISLALQFIVHRSYFLVSEDSPIMNRRLSRWLSSIIFGLTLAASFTTQAQTPRPAGPQSNAPVKVDAETISGLGARNIGSAQMSGRIAAVDAVEERQRRHDLQARLRQAARSVYRRRHHRPEEPENDLGRHGRGVDAQLGLNRRRRL